MARGHTLRRAEWRHDQRSASGKTDYLAALLHDLGLTNEFSADQRFEVDSAEAASRFPLSNGYSESKAGLVWDAISRHSSAGIADRKQPEIDLIDNAPFDS
ncbi:hypothetical protein [Pseudomonas sp. BN417]|uniref:hypothetical protein n=1 Tax=Pseudomonas sp. BN417 TaxID=2567890 RepID=UPI0024565CAB|nr:hypothetical protein [Pseudomonas sp. BN417]